MGYKVGYSMDERLEPHSLAGHLFDNFSLKDLERLLDSDSLSLLMRQWNLSEKQCQAQITLAIQKIKQD